MKYILLILLLLTSSCYYKSSHIETNMVRVSSDSTQVFNIDADINEIDDLSDLDDSNSPTVIINSKTKRSLIEYTLDTSMTVNKNSKLIVKVKTNDIRRIKNATVEIFQIVNNINIIPISIGRQTIDNNNNWTIWEWNFLPIKEGANTLSIYLDINEENYSKNIKIGEHEITISPDMNNYWFIGLNINNLKVNSEENFNLILSKDSLESPLSTKFLAPYNGEIKLNINDKSYTTPEVDFFGGSYYEYNFKHKISGSYTAINTNYYIVGKAPIVLLKKEIKNDTNAIIKVTSWLDYFQTSYPYLWSLIPLFIAWIARRIHRHIKIRNLIKSVKNKDDVSEILARCEEALDVIESKLLKACIIVIVHSLEEYQVDNNEIHMIKIKEEIKQIKRNLYLNYINF